LRPRPRRKRIEVAAEHLVMARARLGLWSALRKGRTGEHRQRYGSADQDEKSTSRHPFSPRLRPSAGSGEKMRSVPGSQ
jgi:hypothetical protein